MTKELHILQLEDREADAELALRELRAVGLHFTAKRVLTEAGFKAELRNPALDLILADFALPAYDGASALTAARQERPEVPFIFVTGTMGEENAIEALHQGATDYVLKQRLSRLCPAVRRALLEVEEHRQREQAEAALRESEANLTRAESFSHIMVCHTALDGRWLKTPPLLSQLLGYPATEMMAGCIQDHFHPDDTAQNWQQMQRLTVSDCRTFGEEKRFVDRSGAVLWLDFHCTLVLAADQKPVLFLVYLRDITQTMQWEEKTRQQARLLNLAPDAIILRDTDDVIFYWNQGAERLYGWTSAEAIGRKTTDLLGQNRAIAETAKGKVMELGEWAGEVRQTTKAGQEVTVSCRWTLLQEPRSPPVILTINTDVTEYKKLELQFLRAQRLESIGRLASGIAHDLNNILAPMLMAPSIIREELYSESAKGLLNTIEANALRGAEIVKQLLTFGRGTESQRGPVQPRSLVREMAKIMQATFPKNITPLIQTPADPWLVTGDATQMHQVLMNLCVNARDAMPKGGELRLTLENTFLDESIASMMPGSKAGSYVLLTVTDTGTGIAPEHLDKIFDPFFTTKELGVGTGLGLSTVLGIVHSHDGFVLVKSKLGQGTQFMVYLPANMTVPMAPAEEREELTPGSGELILVVDDEESIRIMLRRSLAHNGYRVLLAGDGTEALALYAQNQNQVHAVVTDLLMPFMDGSSLIRALHKLNPQVKILAISGQLVGSEVAGTPPLVAQALLSKPFGTGAFLKAMKELLHGKATGGAEAAVSVH